MNAHQAMIDRGWKAFPFEVVRRRGEFTVRATGLAKVFPRAFESSKTGDYFALCGYRRPQDAATQFAAFLRAELKCAGSLEQVGRPRAGEGVHDWLFWGLPNFPLKAAKAESVTGTGSGESSREHRKVHHFAGRSAGELRSGTQTLGAS